MNAQLKAFDISSIWTRAPGLLLSQSAFVFSVARALSESSALSKLKRISLSGPPAALWPDFRASKLEVVAGSDFDGAALACAAGLGAPDEAFGFSALHLGEGGLAGLPHAAKNAAMNTPNANCKNILLFLILSSTFPSCWTT